MLPPGDAMEAWDEWRAESVRPCCTPSRGALRLSGPCGRLGGLSLSKAAGPGKRRQRTFFCLLRWGRPGGNARIPIAARFSGVALLGFRGCAK